MMRLRAGAVALLAVLISAAGAPVAGATRQPARATTRSVVDSVAIPPAATSPSTLAAPAIGLSLVVGGLSNPVFATSAGDGSGRLFIVEKTGRIRIWKNGALVPTPFLDISAQVSGGSEQGLQGLA